MLLSANKTGLGAVHKLRLQEKGGRWSKKLTYYKLLYHRKCKQRRAGGQKLTNLVNIVCECLEWRERKPNVTRPKPLYQKYKTAASMSPSWTTLRTPGGFVAATRTSTWFILLLREKFIVETIKITNHFHQAFMA